MSTNLLPKKFLEFLAFSMNKIQVFSLDTKMEEFVNLKRKLEKRNFNWVNPPKINQE
jgi:hypothetical protein